MRLSDSLYCKAPLLQGCFLCAVCTWQSLEQLVAVLHRAHTSGFCSALEQLSHSVALLLSLSAAAFSVLGICSLSGCSLINLKLSLEFSIKSVRLGFCTK